MDKQSNSDDFDPKSFQGAANYVMELEGSASRCFPARGKLRTIAWLNSAFSGSYRRDADNPALNLGHPPRPAPRAA